MYRMHVHVCPYTGRYALNVHVCLLHVRRYPFTADQNVPDCDWETFLRETANLIVEQQSPQRYHNHYTDGVNLTCVTTLFLQIVRSSWSTLRVTDPLYSSWHYHQGTRAIGIMMSIVIVFCYFRGCWRSWWWTAMANWKLTWHKWLPTTSTSFGWAARPSSTWRPLWQNSCACTNASLKKVCLTSFNHWKFTMHTCTMTWSDWYLLLSLGMYVFGKHCQ